MTGLADATIEHVEALRALSEMLVGVERTISGLQAARDGILAVGSRLALEVASQGDHPDDGDLSVRTVAAEFAAALRVSDRTLQRRLSDAAWVVQQFPAVWRAQGAGRISAVHARAIVEAGSHLDDAAAREAFSAQMMTYAENECPARVRRMARREAERFRPRSIADRHRDAREERAVWVRDLDDGMSELGLLGPSTLVHGVFDRLTEMAKTVQGAEGRRRAEPGAVPCASDHDRASDPAIAPAADRVPDPRTMAQTRADLALDLLLTGAPNGHDDPDGPLAAIRATVAVTVPVLALMGREAGPAELDGCTPIDPATARLLAGAASGWDRVLTHPVTGALLAVDRYRPGAGLRRTLNARDQRCRFPTCGYRSVDCDIGHHHDAALGGPTADTNLGHLCRRHHVLKHHSPWTVEPRGGGVYAWTGPTGRTYLDHPPPQNTVTFTETTEARRSERSSAPF